MRMLYNVWVNGTITGQVFTYWPEDRFLPFVERVTLVMVPTGNIFRFDTVHEKESRYDINTGKKHL